MIKQDINTMLLDLKCEINNLMSLGEALLTLSTSNINITKLEIPPTYNSNTIVDDPFIPKWLQNDADWSIIKDYLIKCGFAHNELESVYNRFQHYIILNIKDIKLHRVSNFSGSK